MSLSLSFRSVCLSQSERHIFHSDSPGCWNVCVPCICLIFSSSILPHLATVAFTSVGGRHQTCSHSPRHCTWISLLMEMLFLKSRQVALLFPSGLYPKVLFLRETCLHSSPVILYGLSDFLLYFFISVHHQVIYIIINYREYFLFYHWDVSSMRRQVFSVLGSVVVPLLDEDLDLEHRISLTHVCWLL